MPSKKDTGTKKIDPRALASITTGVCLIDFSKVREAFDHVLGRVTYTHELPGAKKEATAYILAQYPDMPTEPPEDWQALARDLVKRYGPAVVVTKGNTVRTMSPVETAALLFDGPIVEIVRRPPGCR